jgi:hypothetical protein
MPKYFGSGENPKEKPKALPGLETPDKETEALPFRVEIWDETESYIEQVVALTTNRSIGWAAYFKAQEAYPKQTVIFRDQFGILGRWTRKRH